MQTLEQRVERLERSCRRWRIGFVLAVAGCAAIGAAQPAAPPDGDFAHLTAQSLTIRDQPGGPTILATCDSNRASLTLAGPMSATTIDVSAQKDSGNLLLSRSTASGITSAALRVDDQSGTISVQNVSGKSKDIEPD